LAGSLVDLTDPMITLPSLVVVDANVIVERLSASFGNQAHHLNGPRARNFFSRLATDGSTGIVTPSIQVELAHLLVKFTYRTHLQRNRSALTRQFGPLSSWVDLYKHDRSILRGMGAVFEQLTRLLTASGLYLLDPSELDPLPAHEPLHVALPNVMCRHGLDSTDAMILIEARRASIAAIATFDGDLIQARTEYDIHTWL
jgi:predicted nucleic acid-binding protein